MGSGPVEPVSVEAGMSAPLEDAVDWLTADQNPSGSWGSLFEFPDTTTVVEALGWALPVGPAFHLGSTWLTKNLAADNDELARKLRALENLAGHDPQDLIEALLAARNPVSADLSHPNYPEGGWGLDVGFETDSLTTALALTALARTSLPGGVSVVGETLNPSETNVYTWEVPPGATEVRIVISVAGSDVLLRMIEGSPPTPADPFVTVPVGDDQVIVLPDALPFSAGTNFIAIESPDPPGLAATYTMTASYETPEIDTRVFAEALDYLRQAQNGDGGWGIQTGDPTSLFTSLHVLHALLAWPGYDFEIELVNGIDYLKAQQLPDGSFGVSGTPIPYLTALGVLALNRFEVCPLSASTEAAIAALQDQQATDGSWAQEPYDTGLALLALWEYDNDGDGVLQDGDCSGLVGDNPCAAGVTTGCDDNCVAHANPTQGPVFFGQQIRAADKDTFAWDEPVDVEFVGGELDGVATYVTSSAGSLTYATAFSTAVDQPALGTGYFYLARRAGDCSTSSWQNGAGTEPARDAALP